MDRLSEKGSDFSQWATELKSQSKMPGIALFRTSFFVMESKIEKAVVYIAYIALIVNIV